MLLYRAWRDEERCCGLASIAVLDVGVTREPGVDGGKDRVFGDVAPGVDEVAGWVSPNPGGVGPMTVALLMTNVVEMAERSSNA